MHTPTPWKIHSLVRYENPTPEVKSFDRYIECEPTSADQEFAEIAVNAYESLVNALKKSIDLLYKFKTEEIKTISTIELKELEQALAKAVA